MNVKLTAASVCGAVVIAVAAWVLQGFLEALLAACITAVASWPLYRGFSARMPRSMRRATISLVFTAGISIFVLAPLLFAFVALVTELNLTMIAIAAADKNGMAPPQWLATAPLVGPSLAAHWTSHWAQPGALVRWARNTDPAAFLSWANSLGHFTLRHLFIVAFAILVLFFLYQQGDSLSLALRRVLRRHIGAHAERYVDVARDAIRASVNSMLLVGLFDGFATWAVYAAAGVPQPALWGAITGGLALVPFLGYAAVGALAVQLSLTGAIPVAVWASVLGGIVIFAGDKVVRPVSARNGTHLPYVWGLMGCLGGFEALGLVGLVVGPVALTLSRELLSDLS